MSRQEFLRLVGIGAGITIVPVSLAACGGGGDSGGAQGGPQRVAWASWNPLPDIGATLTKEFHKSHPNITVEYKNQEYNDYIQALKLDIAARKGADVFGVQAGAMLLEYDQFTEDLTQYAQKAWGPDWQKRFYDVGLGQLQENGKTPAIPAFNSAAGYVWYNKTLFDRYDVQPPETYDEWVQVCRKLKSKGLTPFVQGAKDDWPNFDMYIALSNELAPEKIYKAEAGDVSWTDPDLVEAMGIWGEMFENGIMQEGALGVTQYPDAHDTWTKGNAGMILFGLWNNDHMTKTGMKAFQKSLGFKTLWEFLPFRFPDVNGDGQPGRLFGGPDVGLAINTGSEVKDSAWAFIEWMVSEEAQKFFASILNTPSIKGTPLDPGDLLYPKTQKPVLEQELKDFDNAIGPRELRYPAIKTALGDALQNVAAGEQTPKAALADVEKASQGVER
jgi:raffinose/stachyose/melibiose transport system substrate-binding protein